MFEIRVRVSISILRVSGNPNIESLYIKANLEHESLILDLNLKI